MQQSQTGAGHGGEERQFATFYVGRQLMGVDILQVQEINRRVQVTPVPQAPAHVRGVLNLRGDVVTVLDLRTILGLERRAIGVHSRNVVLDLAGDKTALLVDRIGEVVTTRTSELEPAPANVQEADGRFFQAVVKLKGELLAILDVQTVVSASVAGASAEAGGGWSAAGVTSETPVAAASEACRSSGP